MAQSALPTTKSVFDQLVVELEREVKDLYGERLVSLAIFGSVARGVMRPDSDIDVLIIVENLPNGRIPRVREFDQIENMLELNFKAARSAGINTIYSPVIKTPAEVRKGSPLFLDMTLDVQILFDRDDFFRTYLDQLREKMKKMGSKRIAKGGGYYWLLKPDLKPGEDIDL